MLLIFFISFFFVKMAGMYLGRSSIHVFGKGR